MDLRDNLRGVLCGGDFVRTPVVAFPSVLTSDFLGRVGCSFFEANHDASLMADVAGLLFDLCGVEGITIPLDLWFEVESVGYVVERKAGGIVPVVCDAPFDSPGDVVMPSDFVCRGQFPVIERAADLLHERYDDLGVPLIGEVTGAFTLLTDLVDLGKVIKMLNTDVFEVDDALEEINGCLVEEVKFFEDLGVDCIVVNDPSSTSRILKPDLFDDLVSPYLMELSDCMSVPGVLHICGDVGASLEGMFGCGFEGLSVSEDVGIDFVRGVRDRVGSSSVICGNVSIGESLLMGGVDRVRSDSLRCLEDGVDVLGPGCNVAFETPSCNIGAMVDARDEYFG